MERITTVITTVIMIAPSQVRGASARSVELVENVAGGGRREHRGGSAAALVAEDHAGVRADAAENLWVLGGAFLERFVVVLDFENRRLGVAEPMSKAAAAMTDPELLWFGSSYKQLEDLDANGNVMCADTHSLSAPCGPCGPDWGDVVKCQALCNSNLDCNYIVHSTDGGCRLYSSCEGTVTTAPSDYSSRMHIYAKQTLPFKQLVIAPGTLCSPDQKILVAPTTRSFDRAACERLCSSHHSCNYFAHLSDGGGSAAEGRSACGDPLRAGETSVEHRTERVGARSGHLTAACHGPPAVMAGRGRELIMWKGSPYSIRALAALHLKGLGRPIVGYELSEAPGDLETRIAMLPAPHTVPVLRWDGEVVTGTDICAFLDSRFPGEAMLYPQGLECECAVIFWFNGWLSVVDPEGFERFAGALARSHIRSGGAGAAAKLAARLLPKRVMARIVSSAVSKDFVKRMEERGAEAGGAVGEVCGRLAKMKAPRDTARVIGEAREVLLRLDAELQRSSTPFFCGAATPTAADLTLYGMLERWLGDCLCPGAHGASQPSIADGMPGLQACFEAMRERFRPDIELHDLKDYHDLKAPIGPATWRGSS
ncbi:unnamed protein product [Prorocentrum cordatum]|uniref:GST N-terminal domain-containing protein n=1 Tax=Prorocentrum cordatum TaxID=2364126 RepID=A0ABN9VPK7_9DINO|nr:unnamed protein product [Polarella glacialis]